MLSFAEVLIAVSGLEFAFSQAEPEQRYVFEPRERPTSTSYGTLLSRSLTHSHTHTHTHTHTYTHTFVASYIRLCTATMHLTIAVVFVNIESG